MDRSPYWVRSRSYRSPLLPSPLLPRGRGSSRRAPSRRVSARSTPCVGRSPRRAAPPPSNTGPARRRTRRRPRARAAGVRPGCNRAVRGFQDSERQLALPVALDRPGHQRAPGARHLRLQPARLSRALSRNPPERGLSHHWGLVDCRGSVPGFWCRVGIPSPPAPRHRAIHPPAPGRPPEPRGRGHLRRRPGGRLHHHRHGADRPQLTEAVSAGRTSSTRSAWGGTARSTTGYAAEASPPVEPVPAAG